MLKRTLCLEPPMPSDPSLNAAARLLTDFALRPSLEVRHSDLQLELQLEYERTLALRRIGGPRNRRAAIATRRLAQLCDRIDRAFTTPLEVAA